MSLTDALVQNVTKAIAELELRHGTENTKDIPYYRDVFEGISQHYDLVETSADLGEHSAPPILNHLLHLFAGRATKLESSSKPRSLATTSFSGLQDYSGKSGTSDWMALRGMTLATALWKM